jgi:hypothetical protein
MIAHDPPFQNAAGSLPGAGPPKARHAFTLNASFMAVLDVVKRRAGMREEPAFDNHPVALLRTSPARPSRHCRPDDQERGYHVSCFSS